MRNEFRVEPFVNEFGQTINPGDEIMYAGTGWSSTRHNRGVYAGVYYGKYRRYGTQVGEEPIVAVKVTDVPAKKWHYNYDTKTGYHEDIKRHAVLPLKRVYKLA